MSDQPTPTFKYSLQGIELREVQIHAAPAQDEVASGLNFTVNLENLVNEEGGQIVVVVIVNVATQRANYTLGKLVTAVVFSIADLKALIHKDGGTGVGVPVDLLATLNGIAISTARGVMFGAFRGTLLHAALLPLMDVKAFMPELPLSST
jgi:hypothetical protein